MKNFEANMENPEMAVVRSASCIPFFMKIKKLINRTKEKGFAIIPILLFLNEKGFAKLEIAIAKGKKLYDKRDTIKQKDVTRDLERQRI